MKRKFFCQKSGLNFPKKGGLSLPESLDKPAAAPAPRIESAFVHLVTMLRGAKPLACNLLETLGAVFGLGRNPERTKSLHTVLLTLIAALGLWIAYDTLVRDQRAWIAPVDVKIQGRVEVGVPIALKIRFENIGAEPASNVRLALAPVTVISIPPNSHGIPVVPVPPADKVNCSKIAPRPDDMTVFSAPEGRIYDFLVWIFTGSDRNGAYPDFLEYRESFKLQGCIAYRIDVPFPWIGTATRYSGFCYYAQPLPQTAPLYWEFRPCRGGHQVT